MTVYNQNQNVPQVPFRSPVVGSDGILTAVWAAWFRQIFNRVGGANALTNLQLETNLTSIDATSIADGSVTNTEFQYINSLTSNAQTQITTNANNISTNTADISTNATAITGKVAKAGDSLTGDLTFADTKGIQLTTDSTSLNIGTTGSGQSVNIGASDSTVAINGTTYVTDPQCTTGVSILGAGEVKFYESADSDHISLKAPSSLSATTVFTLPGADGSSGQFLKTNGSGTLDWSNAVKGTATNDDAAAGYVGEYVESVISTWTNFPTSGSYGDLASISLTPGDWMCVVQIYANLNSATITGGTYFGVSPNSGSSGSGMVSGDSQMGVPSPTSTAFSSGTIVHRISIASTATYYLKYQSNYSAGHPQARGKICAWRIR